MEAKEARCSDVAIVAYKGCQLAPGAELQDWLPKGLSVVDGALLVPLSEKYSLGAKRGKYFWCTPPTQPSDQHH
jgi:hypothetical protein